MEVRPSEEFAPTTARNDRNPPENESMSNKFTSQLVTSSAPPSRRVWRHLSRRSRSSCRRRCQCRCWQRCLPPASTRPRCSPLSLWATKRHGKPQLKLCFPIEVKWEFTVYIPSAFDLVGGSGASPQKWVRKNIVQQIVIILCHAQLDENKETEKTFHNWTLNCEQT